MWAEFVVGAHPCYEGCSPGSPVFLKKKTNKTKQNKNQHFQILSGISG